MLWRSAIRFFGLVRVSTIAELLFGTQRLGGLFASPFGNAAAVPLPPERKSERSYGEHGKRKSAPAARRGTIFPERLAVRSRPRKTGKLHLAAAAFPNAFPVGRRACPAQIRRMKPAPCVCGFIQSRMAAASSVCFSAEKSLPRQAAARGKDAARFLPTVLRRSARRPSRNAEPWRKRRFRCGLLDAAYGSRRVYPSCGSVGCFCCAAAFSVLHYERPSVSGAWLCCAPSYV